MNTTTTDKAYQHFNPDPAAAAAAVAAGRLAQYSRVYAGGRTPMPPSPSDLTQVMASAYAKGRVDKIVDERRENAGHAPKKPRNQKPRRSRSR